jgi:phospholipid/cholesterol/gamma-HCH transport system substrate-binding protein
MKDVSTELKVGLFAIFVAAILIFMTFKVGGLDWMKKEGEIFHIRFMNVAGLDEKTKVKVAGVDAGVIEKIELREGAADVTVRISTDIPLYSDASASIRASGLLGDRYLEIRTGSREPLLRSGDIIVDVVETVDIDDMVRKLTRVSANISSLAESLNESLGTEEAKRSLRETVLNLAEITDNLNRTIISNDEKLGIVLDNVNELTASLNELIDINRSPLTATVDNLKDFSARLKAEGPDLISNLNKATDDLRAMVEESRPAIQSTVESLDSIASRVSKGEGTLGKLVHDERLYDSVTRAAEGVEKTISAVDRFRTFLTFQGEYLTEFNEAKGYFYLTLQPRPERYYILGVVSDPLGRTTTTEKTKTTSSGTTKVKEVETEKRLEFTAQYAMRYKDAALRLGITENTFGVGGDFFFLDDRGKLTADAWDFGSDEVDSKNPHVKVGVDYYIFKKVFVSAGIDNIFNSKWRGGYAGLGLRLEDEDFKYLLGTLPSISAR